MSCVVGEVTERLENDNFFYRAGLCDIPLLLAPNGLECVLACQGKFLSIMLPSSAFFRGYMGVRIPLKNFSNFIGEKHTFSQFLNRCHTN